MTAADDEMPDNLASDILTIAEYTGQDIEGFNRFIAAAKMCGYELVRNGKPLRTRTAPSLPAGMDEAFKKEAQWENLEISARVLLRYYGFSTFDLPMPVHKAFGDLAQAIHSIEDNRK